MGLAAGVLRAGGWLEVVEGSGGWRLLSCVEWRAMKRAAACALGSVSVGIVDGWLDGGGDVVAVVVLIKGGWVVVVGRPPLAPPLVLMAVRGASGPVSGMGMPVVPGGWQCMQ